MKAPWAITPEKVRDAVQRVISVARPRKVIVFGSAARGDTSVHSDLDILVVTKKEIDSPRRKSVRIRRALRGIVMPMDILVISEKRLEELADQPGLI